jgi:5-histidylcysteine sulfoxide synthase
MYAVESLKSISSPNLNQFDRIELKKYFENSWYLEDQLLKSVIKAYTFYTSPDPLRNLLIFYLGHSAAFYINKLIQVDLIKERLNPYYEIIFEKGVDPENAKELSPAIASCDWPAVDQVWQYREQVFSLINDLIAKTPLIFPIHQSHPLWALMMGIEHQRIHIETSSMLIRQLPVEAVQRPEQWNYAPSFNQVPKNEMKEISSGIVKLGKAQDFPSFGWDIEYGDSFCEVDSFWASQYLITNAEFLDFVQAGGYENPNYWDQKAWHWKIGNNIQYPKFWQRKNDRYTYRATFDEMDLPLDWPVEVNYHEAMAYCRWRGSDIRLMTEAQWQLATYSLESHKNDWENNKIEDYNLNFKFCSPSPVGWLKTAKSPEGLYDLRGNVWEWLADNLSSLPGYQPHPLYPDYSAPYVDDQHQMMLGGSWITSGTEALRYYRNWFRPHFYQHAGFRIVQDL